MAKGGDSISVHIREPLTDPTIAIRNGNYRWISDGRLGSIYHAAIGTQLFDSALGLCGAVVDSVVEIDTAIEPYKACRRCLDQVRFGRDV